MRYSAAAIVAVVLSGCGVDSQPAVTVADSAGVEIVTNLPGSLEGAEEWSLSAEPVVEIGSAADPEVAFFRITDVVALEGGRVAVGTTALPRPIDFEAPVERRRLLDDDNSPQVRIFESDGTPVAAMGGPGLDPGELLSVGSVVPLGDDSLAVWDPDRRLMSVFTTDGRYVRATDLREIAPLTPQAAQDAPPSRRASGGFARLFASTPGSLFLFSEGMVSPGGDGGISRPELPAYHVTTAGDVLARLGPFPGMEMFAVEGEKQVLPLGARTHAAASEGALVVGTAETTELRVYAPTGDLERIVRWPDGDRAVGGPFLATWSEMLESQEMVMVRAAFEAFDIPHAERFPAYDGLISTDAGEILLGDYAGPLGIVPMRRGDPSPGASFWPMRRIPERRWLVFDSDGMLAASVVVPEGFEPYAVRDSLVWGVFSDEIDVESVRAYRLGRP